METKTLIIDNFAGSMTPYFNGDINSGKSFWNDVFGHDPFSKPGDLTWNESAVQIDPNGNVVTDLILAGKVRTESGITYVYCIGHTGRVYKIQVNDPNTYNPNYDNPVLLATLTSGSPTFTRGAFIDFFGATEKIYISHDKGVTSLNFSGTGEAVVGSALSWIQTVPKPLQQFLGNLYVGNGTNLAEIASTGTVTTYTKLSPAFPIGTQVRDIDATPDGNYLQIVVTEAALPDITTSTTDTTIIAPADSYVFNWNGTDTGYTAYTTYPSTVLSANLLFGDQQYIYGYDFLGGNVFNPIRKLFTSLTTGAYGDSPLPNAVTTMGGLMSWASVLPYNGHLELIILTYGTVSDFDIPIGYWCPFDLPATGDETDVQRCPFQLLVSNFAQGASSNGYTNQIFGTPKMYFSTLETSDTPTTAYKFYKWFPTPTGLGTPIEGAIFQTQNQMFSKKIKVSEVRIYGEPWLADNSFIVELIGSDMQPISGSAMTFTAGTNLTIGSDFAWYTPQIAPTYTLGLRITQNGTVNHTISKVEIDYSSGGK